MSVTLTELLKGCSPHRGADGRITVQTIANMAIVPLTADDEYSLDDRFANPMDEMKLKFSNRSYGELRINNTSDKPVIVPAQIAVLNDAGAQNHGMVKAAYIKAFDARQFDDAGCVQGSQHGSISEGHNNQIRFLPLGTREYVWEKVNHHDLSNIYAAITKVGHDTGVNSDKYLDKYFAAHGRRLEEFIAHFERPAKTIGAIVIVNGEILAIDKFPSFRYAAQVWDALVRDCYSSVAIAEEVKRTEPERLFTKTLGATEAKRGESAVQRLRRALESTRQRVEDRVRDRVAELMEVQFTESRESTTEGYASDVLTADGYVGQSITEAGYRHLVSVVRKDSFKPETFRRSRELREKAGRQRPFKM